MSLSVSILTEQPNNSKNSLLSPQRSLSLSIKSRFEIIGLPYSNHNPKPLLIVGFRPQSISITRGAGFFFPFGPPSISWPDGIYSCSYPERSCYPSGRRPGGRVVVLDELKYRQVSPRHITVRDLELDTSRSGFRTDSGDKRHPEGCS